MKRYNRSISVLLFSVMSVLTLWAEPISEAAALQEARAFLAQRGRTDALLAPIQAAAYTSTNTLAPSFALISTSDWCLTYTSPVISPSY